MNIAIVGCGFVADYYLSTLPAYPELKLIGVTDRDPDRALKFAAFHGVSRFGSLADLLNDSRVQLVLNLTNPRSHYEVTRACARGWQARLQREATGHATRRSRRSSSCRVQGLHGFFRSCSLLGETARPSGRLFVNAGSERCDWFTPRWMMAWCSGCPTENGRVRPGSPGRRRMSSRSAAHSSMRVTTDLASRVFRTGGRRYSVLGLPCAR